MATAISLLALSALTAAPIAKAGLEQIEHVVFFMQENRAFDHYYGHLAGVRGLSDPQTNNKNGSSTLLQKVAPSLSNATQWLTPYYINEAGGNLTQGSQCMLAGSNSLGNNEAALNGDLNDQWVNKNSPYSIGYYKRSDLPTHYTLADGWTTADMYQEGIISATWPNRILWQTGSINVPGGNVNSTQGPVYDNTDVPGCTQLTITEPFTGSTKYEATYNVSCYPYDWKTVPEYLEETGIEWMTYQASDNFGTDVSSNMKQFIDLADTDPTSQLAQRALKMQPGDAGLGGLEAFKKAAAAGKLPQFSYVYGPKELSEHPPYSPHDGGWFVKELVDAVQNSPQYNTTALFLSFDETGGWGDHVIPFHSPNGTAGEWLTSPFTGESVPSGPGFRLPFNVVSPWTRGGYLFTEPSDHTSHILFLEKWLAAHGKSMYCKEMNDWRRNSMSDLTNIFDFNNPDFSPVLLELPEGYTVPHRDPLTSVLDGAEHCEAAYNGTIQPKVPYGQQDLTSKISQESGFKNLRGALTEGRYLVFEQGNNAAAVISGALTAIPALAHKQLEPVQRFLVHAVDSTNILNRDFTISNGASFLTSTLSVGAQSSAATFTVLYSADKMGYTFMEKSSGNYISIGASGVTFNSTANAIKLYSVTF